MHDSNEKHSYLQNPGLLAGVETTDDLRSTQYMINQAFPPLILSTVISLAFSMEGTYYILALLFFAYFK